MLFGLLVDRLKRVHGPNLAPMIAGEGGVGGDSILGVRKRGGGLGSERSKRVATSRN